MYNLELIGKFVSDYNSHPVDQVVSAKDAMNNQWYFEVGRSAVEVILAGIMSSYVHRVDSVLDLPCGHGRVMRHLVRMFPHAKFHACDLDTDGVDYCAKRFNAVPVVSKPELTEVDFGTQFDLIWVGSLFTHISASQSAKWLAHLARFLTPNGIVVATMHGRWSEHVNRRAPYLGADRWETVMEGYRTHGYGYSDYVQEESHDYVPGNYGISMARPHAMMRMLEAIDGIRVFSYSERAWADHQDVIVYGKPAYDMPWA
ncbi:class I SAM-dependent methyltransferase [Dyella tabacisoli]|uniref:Class I SAM-dependent methyltransferase n=1 Tax=Dyella tabacisoli TaxID=2282381 RepID=A0A369UJR1_9GAMM|nr:class I SAM-dependent methyltransferase [Dyella tabacisoli]RDD80583.1 class I SAM-dependent methyltransferase [Dyella tabacisoli]